MNYKQLKDKQQKRINELDLMFAFSDQQFMEQLENHGWTLENHPELFNIGSGGFCTEETLTEFKQVLNQYNKELAKALKDDKFFVDAVIYEAWNHEYAYNPDNEEILECFNLTVDELQKDEKRLNLYNKAIREYLKEFNELN